MKHKIQTDDGIMVDLGSTVWINNSCRGSGPQESILLGVRSDNDKWPYRVKIAESTMEWAHVYSTRDAAIAADPYPEIAKLRHRLDELEKLISGNPKG